MVYAMKKASSRKKKTPAVEEELNQEHVVVQLPIQVPQPDSSLTPAPLPSEPEPYTRTSQFISDNDIIPEQDSHAFYHSHKNSCCYWCCHAIEGKEFGIPIKYDTQYKTFTTYGSFCSLECVVAYNYDRYMGTDRMWEIHSWIQWMAERMGYPIPVRPAPDRYLLKMFNGPLDIASFREAHKDFNKSYVFNMPPLIHIQGQMEAINTSFLANKSITTTDSQPKVKLARKKAVMDVNKTLDSKLNLTVKKIQPT